MDLETALSFAARRTRGVLSTIRRDGRPQLSNVMFVADGDTFSISVTEARAKTRNLRRDPRAVLYVPGEDFWNFVVLDGTATLTEVASDVNDGAVDQLVDYYRRGAGEHPDWEEYRAMMVAERRLLVRLLATSAYGMLQA